jgi:hypothetical protein
MPQDNQIHLDLETLDTAHTAQILSIGACYGAKTFYAEVDTKQYDPVKFTFSQATNDWWKKQGGFKPSVETQTPYEAVFMLATWIEDIQANVKDPLEIWANAPSFDCAILKYHFTYMNIECPWRFFMERDVRTVKALATQMHLNIRTFKNPHNALQDAMNQQKYVDSVYMTLADQLHSKRDMK